MYGCVPITRNSYKDFRRADLIVLALVGLLIYLLVSTPKNGKELPSHDRDRPRFFLPALYSLLSLTRR